MIEKILGGAPEWTVAQLEEKFPPRKLPEGAETTRFAPSPTGFMHIGGLYQALIDWKIARDSGGVFYLRIDDTDQKREVPEAVRIIIDSLNAFGLVPDEIHTQSERKDIYHAVAADLLGRGLAYPCFMTAEDMERVRAEQKMLGHQTGIYGEWARDRDITPEEIEVKLAAGYAPTIRLYSTGDPANKIYCKDLARGSIAFPENFEDTVLIKSGDRLPTYHFAHLVDDHFMRTTTVVRAEEWLSSFPLHIRMFQMMGWTPPKYIHTSTLDKIDSETGKQRKLSKRKDPEASVENFIKDGWPIEAVRNYLFNIAASGFEDEIAKKPETNIENYPLKIKKIPTSGALFDWKKLEWWAKEFIATLSVDELARRVMEYAAPRVFDKEYLTAILGIERDNPKRIRKDFITWKQTIENIEFFFAEDKPAGNDITKEFLKVYNPADTKDEWWAKIQDIAARLGVKNGDVAMALRVALSGREQTPDLYSMIYVMGPERVEKRLKND